MYIIYLDLLWLRRLFNLCFELSFVRIAFCSFKIKVKLILLNYMGFFFASIMDIVQYCRYIGNNFLHRNIMKRKKIFASTNWVFSKLMLP